MNTSKASKTLLLLLSLAIFASTSGQRRSARQDEAGETNLLNEENLENDAEATPAMTTRNLWRRTQTDGGESVDAVPIPSLQRNGRTCASRAGAKTCRSLSPLPPLSQSIDPSQGMI